MPEENNETTQDVIARTSDWIENAAMFFAGAENLIGIERAAIPKMACLMAQATAERFLKAFLVFNRQSYREYGHDLPSIIEACAEVDAEFSGLLQDGKELNVYRRQVNYPDLHAAPLRISEDEAKEAIDQARRIRDFVLLKLRKYGYREPEY